MSREARSDFFDSVTLLASGHVLKMPVSRNLSGIYPGLHELRIRGREGQIRIFYYIKKKEAIYLIHAFWKKTQKIPKKEINLVLRRIKEV